MLRLLVADDHDLLRRGLRGLLEEHDGWQVCAEARNGREAVELAAKLQPDIAVVDLSMPEMNGLEATRQILRDAPETEVLIFTMHETEQLVRDVVHAGARGYVLKSDAAAHLVTAVEALAHHRPYFSSRVSDTILAGFLRAGRDPEEGSGTVLTAREREIVQLLAEGKSNKDVAATLVISIKTVETHRATIMRKLGINSIVELVHYAVRNKLIEP
jgi:DNA-binding NarL/FixJ family response regulator